MLYDMKLKNETKKKKMAGYRIIYIYQRRKSRCGKQDKDSLQ